MTTAPNDYSRTTVVTARDLEVGDIVIRIGTADVQPFEVTTITLDGDDAVIAGVDNYGDESEAIVPVIRNLYVTDRFPELGQ